MGSIRKAYVTLSSTTSILPSGTPLARGLNLGALGSSDSHGSHGVSARSDYNIPKWAARNDVGPMGIISRTRLTASSNQPLNTRLISTSSKSLRETTQVPDYTPYTKGTSESSSRAYSYFMVGSMGLISAAGAKSVVSDFLTNMSASSDVLALAKVEVDLSEIPEGKNVIIKWRGKPVFIRHRTSGEIDEANQVDVKSLRDPQTDADRVKKPQWLVMLGVCTHLGCVPIGEAGDYGGWASFTLSP